MSENENLKEICQAIIDAKANPKARDAIVKKLGDRYMINASPEAIEFISMASNESEKLAKACLMLIEKVEFKL